MSSYFEKLTSLNSLKFTNTTPSDLTSALEKIEELKSLNNKLSLDLKCEHDEKNELVSLKVSLESEILNLREINDRLNFQVTNLKSEKDHLHSLLANLREETTTTGSIENRIKRYPSVDDLSFEGARVTPSTSYSHLERIDEVDDETASLVDPRGLTSSFNNSQLLARISELESEVSRLTNLKDSYDEGIFTNENEGTFEKSLNAEEARYSMLIATQRKIIQRLETIHMNPDHTNAKDIEDIKQHLITRMNAIIHKLI